MLGKLVRMYIYITVPVSTFRHVDKVILFAASLLLLSQKSETFAKKVALVGPGLLQCYVA